MALQQRRTRFYPLSWFFLLCSQTLWLYTVTLMLCSENKWILTNELRVAYFMGNPTLQVELRILSHGKCINPWKFSKSNWMCGLFWSWFEKPLNISKVHISKDFGNTSGFVRFDQIATRSGRLY